MLIGYARVSTIEQETHAQTDALAKAGCQIIYEEKRSGGNLDRPALVKMLTSLRPGDTVTVYKLDRIARSLKDLLIVIERIEDAGAAFKSLTEIINTEHPAGRMILQILGAFAEFERELIRERTQVGMQAAAERGAKFGRARGVNEIEEAELIQLWFSGEWTKSALARRYGIHISSVKRAIKRTQETTCLKPFALEQTAA